MKLPFHPDSLGHRAQERTSERERRYPIYSAFDFLTYWCLCAGLLLLSLALVGVILINNSPQVASHATWITSRFFG